MSQEYIHINKACKKYSKSRQTFYNYMKKDRIRHKKVHNKVFLHVADIDAVLSDTQQFVTISRGESELEIIAPSKNQIDNNDVKMINGDQTKNISQINSIHQSKKMIDDMHTSLSTHIDMTAQDLRNDTKNQIQQATNALSQKNGALKDKVYILQQQVEKSSKQNNIHQFVYIFVLIAVIISITLRLFN